MNDLIRTPLATLIALTLWASSAAAQDEEADDEPVKPGLYTTVDENEIYLIVGDEQFDLETGESAYLGGQGLERMSQAPGFLDWPCGTEYAMNRGALARYAIDDLPERGRVQEIVRRYFEETQVPDGTLRFLNGEYHGRFPVSEIEQLLSGSYWYRPGPPDAPKAAQRPKVLIISVFWGSGQVVVDPHFLEELKAHYGTPEIPVLFQFPEEYEVPISYFGDQPGLEEIILAFRESGIRPADVPMWFAGDHHASIATDVLVDRLDLPEPAAIDADQLEALLADLRAFGFSRKPLTLTLTPGADALLVDQGERVRAAQSLGIDSIPVMFAFFTEASHAAHCGLPPPISAVGALGTSNSGRPDAPGPDKPPEIELPDPPQVEPPASGS